MYSYRIKNRSVEILTNKRVKDALVEWGESTDVAEAVNLRYEYWRLGAAARQIFEKLESEKEQPITCFIHPKLTPIQLLEFLLGRGASDACIVYWMRRLQEVRDFHDPDPQYINTEDAYAVEMMGK